MDLEQQRRSYYEGEETKGYDLATDILASLGFPVQGHFPGSPDTPSSYYPARSPVSPDFKIAATSSHKAQPVYPSSRKDTSSHGSSPRGTGRIRAPDNSCLKLLDSLSRSLAAISSLVAFCVMITTREMRAASGSTFEVKFSDFYAYYYLVAVHVLSFIYSSAQVLISLSGCCKSKKGTSPSLRSGACKYFCDWVMVIFLVSASSAAAAALELSHNGLHNIWPPACSTWKLSTFCLRTVAVVILSFVSSFCVILSSLLTGVGLLCIVSLE